MGDKVLLPTENLRLHETRKFWDRFVGLFTITERIGNIALCLDLLQLATLRGIHDVFNVSLLRGWLSNGVHTSMPQIKIDGEAEYKAAEIKYHHEQHG